MQKTAVFTIASKNYISYARTLMGSLAQHHPEAHRFLLLVDQSDASLDLSNEGYSVVLAKDIGIESFSNMAFMYDIMEFNTAVKPFFMSYLLQKGYSKVVYLDPDIMLFSRMDVVLEALDRDSIVLTPHITSPVPYADKYIPGERDYLSVGTYNLGFIAVSKSDESSKFLDWWSERCQHECFSEVETGYFVDQKWINLVPGLFSSVKILRDPGCNVAYWNLHERFLNDGIINNEAPLVFFHFSGIDPSKANQLSKYQNRFTLEGRSDLKGIFKEYRNRLIDNGYFATICLPYEYDCYDNGDKIGPFARRMFATNGSFTGSPFTTGRGTYHEFLKSKRLLERPSANKYTKENTFAMRGKLNAMLIFLSRTLGGNRYYALMKYLRHIAVLRKQDFLLGRHDHHD